MLLYALVLVLASVLAMKLDTASANSSGRVINQLCNPYSEMYSCDIGMTSAYRWAAGSGHVWSCLPQPSRVGTCTLAASGVVSKVEDICTQYQKFWDRTRTLYKPWKIPGMLYWGSSSPSCTRPTTTLARARGA